MESNPKVRITTPASSDLEGFLTGKPSMESLETGFPSKKYSTDERLKKEGWMEFLKNGHERDAARHGLYYLAYRESKKRGKKK